MAAPENELPPSPPQSLFHNGQQQQQQQQPEPSSPPAPPSPLPEGFMQKFRLYETRSKFYMIGRDKSRTYWRVLKIDRMDPSELNVREDSATYTERECSDLLRRIHEGNRSTGGLKFVSSCYGIVGFIKFLGPYYMLLITKRRQIGSICGHSIYAVSKSEIIPLENSSVWSKPINNKSENRYKKLLCMVDLTKDFFFSYSYHVIRSLQKNMSDNETGQVVYETMFVWNEFLTRGIRNILHNTLWTVALAYGFFKQATLSISGQDFKLALIARRSRHYAGTRYLKRGVNEKGRVANDVETEQIVFEDVPEGYPMQISSVVQNRGSIPLFWSQETSRLNLKPDIILSKKDQTYEATRLHFENLIKRYGNPIIILNLIKTHEKKPRESILRAEFANAIEFINKDLSEENRLRFLHWDLSKHSRRKATNVLFFLGKVASYALALTGFFYCQTIPPSRSEGYLRGPCLENTSANTIAPSRHSNTDNDKFSDDEYGDSDTSKGKSNGSDYVANGNSSIKPSMFQKGVLRTNCIDCLDRTNVAQYAYGLAALGHQLHALGVTNSIKVDLDDPLAEDLMGFYERMGDTLAHQYGGSAAHNKIFSERRGQWNAAIQSQEFFRTLQRYYSNAYMDAMKQNAINVFLGYFQPQEGNPDIWELDSDQHYSVGRNGESIDENGRSLFKRSMSDGNILRQSCSPMPNQNFKKDVSVFTNQSKGNTVLSESSPEISMCESDLMCSRYTPSMPAREFFAEIQKDRCLDHENGEGYDSSNFVDLDWLSSSGNSCEEELMERSISTNSPITGLSSDNIVNGVGETTPSTSEGESSVKGRGHVRAAEPYKDPHSCEVLKEFSDSFIRWVTYGETLCH